MEKTYKLYIVSSMGPLCCWHVHAAASPEEAMFQCFKVDKHMDERARASCRVEELKVEGFEIRVIRKDG